MKNVLRNGCLAAWINHTSPAPRPGRFFGLAFLLLTLAALLQPIPAPAAPVRTAGALAAGRLVSLDRDLPIARLLREAHRLGPLDSQATVRLAFTLPLRSQGDLNGLLQRLNRPGDPLFHHYLSPAEFTARFGPPQADYDALLAFVRSHGLTVTQTSAGRTLLLVSGTSQAVASALHVRFGSYQTPDGRIAYANENAPRLPAALAARIGGIVGLDTLAIRRRFSHQLSPLDLLNRPHQGQGTGPNGGLSPSDIRLAYNLNTVNLSGEGQTIAVYELDGYTTADIKQYATTFNLPVPNLQNVLLNGFLGFPGTNSIEVTLDIELVTSLAPRAAQIRVYEADNSDAGNLAIFNQFVQDNQAQTMSISFGLSEQQVATDVLSSENTALQQAAAQGQTVFASSGDTGAYDNVLPDGTIDVTTPAVDDPASQPFVTGVGGTSLTLNTDGTYQSETTWNNGKDSAGQPLGASGGGISTIWAKPAYQKGFGLTATAAAPMREVPDVSLNADPNTGYAVYYTDPSPNGNGAGFVVLGGTSAAAPVWAGYNALVNEQRQINGLGLIGQINTSLYTLAGIATTYASVFHDIADGSDNLDATYKTIAGYDDSTGLGTPVGDKLLAALAPSGQSTTGTLTGHVTDVNGLPIANATITVTQPQFPSLNTTVTTDANGLYTVTLSSSFSYYVAVDAAGFAGRSASGVTVPPSGTTTLNFSALAPGRVFPAGLQMVSTPYDYSTTADFATLFGLTPPVGAGMPRLAAWETLLNQYVVYPTSPADTFRLGQGYWLRLPSSSYIHREGVLASLSGPFRITLQPGWNIVGNPFLDAVTTASLMADTVTPGTPVPLTSSSLIRLPFYTYPPDNGSYVTLGPNDSLNPWQGYWIYANQASVLVVPAPSAPPPPAAP